jgi:hypothetical protein
MDIKKPLTLGLRLALVFFLGGCASVNSGSNNGQVQSYSYPAIEAAWIRDGKPIQYEGHKWYPANDYEVLDDAEVYQVAEFKGVQVFVEKISTKPYNRIYTKFDKNKFRYYERRGDD